jgi:hypothetical protein
MVAILKADRHRRLFHRGRMLFVASIGFTSCGSLRPNCHGPFTTYLAPIYKGSPLHPLRTDGVYVSEDGLTAMFFYANGRTLTYPFLLPRNRSFWNDPDSTLKRMIGSKQFQSKEGWGEVTFDGDSLIEQSFGRSYAEPCKRIVFDYRGVVLNDTSFSLQWIQNMYQGTVVLDTARHYRFYSTPIKADSTLAWHAKKRWFLKERHPSRR